MHSHHVIRLIVTCLTLCTAAYSYGAEQVKTRFFLLQGYSVAAEFSLQRGSVVVWVPTSPATGEERSGGLIEFDGVLDQEAADVISRLVQRRKIGVLSLSSPGGLIDPTLRLGRVVHSARLTTVVEGGKECYSACALLFLAGTQRLLGEFTPYYNSLARAVAAVGFHAPYVPQKDGTAIYLQDVKSTPVCPYIRAMLPRDVADELCDYSLATKGMALFTLDFGRELGVFTASESEVAAVASERLLANSSLANQGWVACERYKNKLLAGRPRFALSDEYKRLTSSCAWNDFTFGPKDPQVRTPLWRATLLLGPADMPENLRIASLEAAASKLQRIGLKDSDEHSIRCQQAKLFLDANYPALQPSPEAAQHHKTWGRNCFHRVFDTTARMRMGVGIVASEVIPELHEYMAKRRGAEWFPQDYVPMAPSFPLPKEYE